MSKKLDIYFICGAGLGSSLACQMEAEDVFVAEGEHHNLYHDSISSITSVRADIIISAENFRSQIEKYELPDNTDVVYLHNIVDKGEIAEKVLPLIKKRAVA